MRMTRSQPGAVLTFAWYTIHGSVPSGDVVKPPCPTPNTLGVREKTGPVFVQLEGCSGSAAALASRSWPSR